MKISCLAKLKLHCLEGTGHEKWITAAVKTKCKKNTNARRIYRRECCNCGKVKYYSAAVKAWDNRIPKWHIDWPRTAELNLGETEQ